MTEEGKQRKHLLNTYVQDIRLDSFIGFNFYIIIVLQVGISSPILKDKKSGAQNAYAPCLKPQSQSMAETDLDLRLSEQTKHLLQHPATNVGG